MKADPKNRPIEEVLDDLLPDWREQVKKLAAEGMTDAEITGELQRQMRSQIDPLLDLYNDLHELQEEQQ